MRVIGEDGCYKYVGNTKTISTSENPIHQARIELALPLGQWLFAPSRGHQLKKYDRKDQNTSNSESFQKEMLLYLDKYGPEVTDVVIKRGVQDLSILIKEDVLNV